MDSDMADKRPTRPCGNRKCSVSTGFDDMTLTFGSGFLDDYGYWEKPCEICAADHLRRHPEAFVWPSSSAPEKEGGKPEICDGQRWVRKSSDHHITILYRNLVDGSWEIEDDRPWAAGRPRRSISEKLLREKYELRA